jgi:hypothetical protein
MTYRYTKLDDDEGLDGGPRYEIDDVRGFTICVVDDEETARLFCAAQGLLTQLARMVETFAPDHESDFAGFGLDHFKAARAVIARAIGQQGRTS